MKIRRFTSGGVGSGPAPGAPGAPIVSVRSAATVSHSYILAPTNATARLALCSKVLCSPKAHWGGGDGGMEAVLMRKESETR